MTAILISGVVGLVGTLLGTPLLIRYLHAKEYGQFIRQDGPQGHFTKRGTPTMGGLVIIISTVLGYTLANLSQLRTPRLRRADENRENHAGTTNYPSTRHAIGRFTLAPF
ncbi:MAG: hypothetical protein ACFNLH_08855 [Corynebacterium matruchotii]